MFSETSRIFFSDSLNSASFLSMSAHIFVRSVFSASEMPSSFGLNAARYWSKSSLNLPLCAVSRRLMTPSILEKNVSSSKTEKFSKRGLVLLP